MSRANPSQKKRRHKGKTPPGPDQAVIGWKEEEFHNLVREMGFRPEWGAQYPTVGSTAMDAPPGYLTLYAAFFREGNFRLPITKFTASVLRNYGLHISQINAIGLPRVTHFEFVCRANRVDPTFEMFNVFYCVTYTNGFYSFNSRTGVTPVCSAPLKSLHDWKQKFFYIRRGAIPVDMHYWSVGEGIPKIDVLVGFAEQDWYKKITHKATSISQLEEMALVGAAMSLLWFPKNPLGVPVYGYQGKFGYSLLNVLDPKAAGAMVEAIQEDGKSTWLNQIRGRFLHPSDDSFAKYANVVLGEDDEDDPIDPTREEVVVLSSGSSGRSSEGLTSRCVRAGPAQVAVNEPVHEVVGDDEEIPVETASQLESRKKTKAGASGRKEKGVEDKAADTSRKRPSTLPVLDYVVVSDTLSGLGAEEKPRGSDPDDRSTLTEMMRKKALEDKKLKLDEQAAALLASKKAKLRKEVPLAPSESDIDMGIFSGDRGNLLEEIFATFAPTGKGFIVESSRVRVRAGLIFQKSLLLLLLPRGRLIYLLPTMTLVRRRRRKMK
uniref:Transposase (putative) gypsy type domain-containing protein n=1 Tax=Helianthus annuus TaxID=4232 RepID=A0A251VG72_HELAN